MQIIEQDVRRFNRYSPRELMKMNEHGAVSDVAILRVLLDNGELLEATAGALIDLIKHGKEGTTQEDLKLFRRSDRRRR